MARSDAVHVALLLLDFSTSSFKDKSAGDHLAGFESFDFRDEKPFRSALQIRQHGVGFRLYRQTKSELKIVHQADAGRRNSFARQIVHECEAVFERGKKDRSVFLNPGQRKILTTAAVIIPSVPSEPNIKRRKSRPTDSRGEALVRSSLPEAVTTTTSSTRSSMLP